MKKNLMLILAAAALLSACSDSADVRDIRGGYHFKTSGQVTVSNSGADPYPLTLTNETGLLEVVSLHADDSILITFNQTNGGVYTTRGTTDGKLITLEPFDRTATLRVETTYADTITSGIGIFSTDSIISVTAPSVETFDLHVSGYGEVYDNNLIFHLTYDGRSQSSAKTVAGSDISMLAKKN